MADDIRAHANYIGHSPQKVRLVIDLVRGRDIVESELCNG
jgi:ribosomal protein L22